jgi:hypothetical protein
MNFEHFVDPAFEQFMLALHLFIQADRDFSLLKTTHYHSRIL